MYSNDLIWYLDVPFRGREKQCWMFFLTPGNSIRIPTLLSESKMALCLRNSQTQQQGRRWGMLSWTHLADENSNPPRCKSHHFLSLFIYTVSLLPRTVLRSLVTFILTGEEKDACRSDSLLSTHIRNGSFSVAPFLEGANIFHVTSLAAMLLPLSFVKLSLHIACKANFTNHGSW